ncbi:MAG: hypothetical protein M3Q96_03295, partial [Pseudomonadota bacterium]|nr:hypothetical protein [Pseudomonadota bacterium]
MANFTPVDDDPFADEQASKRADFRNVVSSTRSVAAPKLTPVEEDPFAEPDDRGFLEKTGDALKKGALSLAFAGYNPRLPEAVGRIKRSTQRGAVGLISNTGTAASELLDTAQAPLRNVMDTLAKVAPGAKPLADAYQDPLGARAATKKFQGVNAEMAAERQTDVAATGGRPNLFEVLSDPLR